MNKEYIDNYNYIHTITKELSRGGQGVVYRTTKPNIAIKVEIDSKTNKEVVDATKNEKFNKIRLLPIPLDTKITIPQATLKSHSGYVMSLLEDMESFSQTFYKPDKELYKNNWLEGFSPDNEDCAREFGDYIKTGGKRRRLLAYLKAGVILSKLHMNGLVYCDFSDNNVFLSSNHEYYNVWLIDADNLNYQAITQKGGYYTPGYAAPELYQGKGATMYSDVYSFAISLFWNLTNSHPFRGEYVENYDGDDLEEIEEIVYKGELPWILDEDDDSNYLQTKIPTDLILSSEFIKMFDNTFCETGKSNRKTRPTIFQWTQAIAKELDITIKCNNCEMEYIAKDYDECPWCDEENKIINIKSYNYDKNKKNNMIWEYYQEIDKEQTKHIPHRISQGYKTDYIDEILFNIKIKNQKIEISNFNDEFEFIKTDSGDELYGEYIIQSSFKLLCKEKKSDEIVLLEVSIV